MKRRSNYKIGRVNFGTVRSIAEWIIKINTLYTEENLRIIPKELLNIEVTENNYNEVIKKAR